MEECDNEFDHDEPVVANIILPNRPHHTAVQVEEVGSFKLGSISGQTYLTAEEGFASSTVRQGIIDEVDSDTGEHSSTAFRRTVMRNVSIVSATSDDEQHAMMTSGRDISVDEIERNVVFENGQSNIRVTKTVIEEQQVVEVDENGVIGEVIESSNSANFNVNDSKQESIISDLKPNDGHKATLHSLEHSKHETNETIETATANTLSEKIQAKQAKLWTVESVNEEEEIPIELTEEELRRQRIKDIRQRARKGSLYSKEVSNERNTEDISISQVHNEIVINDEPLSAKYNDIQQKTELDANGDNSQTIEFSELEPTKHTPQLLTKCDVNVINKQVSLQPLETGPDHKSHNAKTQLIKEAVDEEDEYMAALLKRGQAQRAVLQQILSHEDNSADLQNTHIDLATSKNTLETSQETLGSQVPTAWNSKANEYDAPLQHEFTIDSGQGIHLITIRHMH